MPVIAPPAHQIPVPPDPPPLVAAPDRPPAILLPDLPPSLRRASAPRPAPPARILVFANEYRLNPSRRVVPAGRVWIQVGNIGQDDHDLAVRRADGRLIGVTAAIRPGALATLRVRLTPGRYTLVCTVPGHEAHGMTAPLTVRKRARSGS